MSDNQVYDYRVYTRRRTADDWHSRSDVLCSVCGTHAGAKMGKAVLNRYYGPGDSADHGPVDLMHCWVRVSLCMPSGEVDIFYGLVAEQRLDEGARSQHWVAYEVKELLARSRIVAVHGEKLLDLRAVPVRPCVFNRDLHSHGGTTGFRSNYRYHFSPPDRGTLYNDGEATHDVAYAFGNAEPWNGYEMLEHLLRVCCPRVTAGYESLCPAGFDLHAQGAAREKLEANCGEYNFFGTSLLDAIDTLIRDSGDLSWFIDWGDDGLHGYDFPLIRVFSKDYAERDTEESVVDPDDVLPVCIDDDGVNRVSEVWAFGGPCKVMLTVRSDTSPGFSKGWPESLENDWDAFNPEALRYSMPYFQKVYREFEIGISSNWESVFVGPDLEEYEEQPGDMIGAYPRWRMEWYNRQRPFLPHNITRAGVGYLNQDDFLGEAMTQDPAMNEGEPACDYHPLTGWLVPNTETEAVLPIRLIPLAGRGGFRVLDHPLDLALHQDGRWEKMIVTGTVEADWLLLAKARDEKADDGVGEIRFVFEPAYQWWAARPDTIIHVSPQARWGDVTSSPPQKCLTVYGVIRNDYPKLKALAENTLKKFNAVKRAVSFRFKTVSASLSLGMFVTEYSGYNIYAPVMSVQHRLSDDETYGTRVHTLFPAE